MPPTAIQLPSGRTETVDETVQRARELTSVSADDLATPVQPVQLPEPMQSPERQNDGIVSNVRGVLGTTLDDFRTTQQERQKLLQQQADMAGEGTLSELFQQQQEELQIPQNILQLQDIQLQLADLSSESLGRRVEGAREGGRTMRGVSLTDQAEVARNNVRSYSLAAQAAVLQGNIQTAQAAAREAVNIAYQDRQIRNQNLINQINSVQAVLGEQRNDLLEAEKRQYEEDQRQIMRAEAAVDSAVASGYATGAEIQKLVELSGDPAMQRDYAYGIVARGAVEDRILQQQAQRASIAASATSRRRNLVELGLTGDPQAIAELGFDPRTQLQEEVAALEAEEKAQMEIAAGQENERLQTTLDQLTELMGNKTGLEASSGQFRNATISGFVPFVGDDLTQISGGLPGAISARTEKDDWLATMSNILTQDGFESLIEVNERVRLTPITNAEIALAFKSAGELQNAAIYKGNADEGTQRIVGFRMSEDKVRENLAQMYLATQKAQEEAAYINQYGYDGLLELQQLQAEAQAEQ